MNHHPNRTLEKVLVTSVLLLSICYAGSYLAWTRIAMIQYATMYDTDCYFFVEPTTDRQTKMDAYSTLFYYPLITIDQQLGTGVVPCGCDTGMSP